MLITTNIITKIAFPCWPRLCNQKRNFNNGDGRENLSFVNFSIQNIFEATEPSSEEEARASSEEDSRMLSKRRCRSFESQQNNTRQRPQHTTHTQHHNTHMCVYI